MDNDQDKAEISPLQLHIAERVRAVRDKSGMKTADFADLLGLTDSQARRLEQGKSRFSTLQLYLIAKACNTPVSYFFTTYDQPPEEAQRIRDVLLKEPMDWDPATRDEKEAALMAIWRALPSEQHRNRLLNLFEILVYPLQKGAKPE